MTTVYDVPADMLIREVAEDLKKNGAIQPPPWAIFVKTGAHKERAPVQKDWWYVRVAAVLRKIYVKGPIGIERLKAEYGGKKDDGSAPYHARSGSGSIARVAVHQLEQLGYVTKDKTNGRIVTRKGRSYLDDTAHKIMRKLATENKEFAKYM